MPAPKYKTKLGKLRRECRLRQDEFAALVGRSVFTIQSLESGKHALSEELAIRVAEETGVSFDWLLRGDEDSKPVEAVPAGGRRAPYTRTSFERHRHALKAGGSTLEPATLPGLLGAEIDAILASALKDRRGFSALYRIGKFIDDLRTEFGSDSRTREALTAIAVQSHNLGHLQDPEMECYAGARTAITKALKRKPVGGDDVLPARGPGALPFLAAAYAIGKASLSLRPSRGKRVKRDA